MQTQFPPELLADPAMRASERVIRSCVHCGFCTATCPTYVLLGDELDSPRGRIALIKDMLEYDRTPGAEVVKHIDRCLSCLSCMTTCPSGVNYMHLIDHARAHVEARYRRPLGERMLRSILASVLPYRARFRLALRLAPLGRPLLPILRAVASPLAAMVELAPRRLPKRSPITAPPTQFKGRVALLRGCIEPELRPEFQVAAERLLARAGYAVVDAPDAGCCGALVQHIGRHEAALDAARRNVAAWSRLIEQQGIEAIVITASGCGTTIKDYGFMLRDDPDWADAAAKVSALAQDITEFLARIDLPPGNGHGLTVAYHPACSLQHGQKVVDAPKLLLERAGYIVKLPAEAHLCCGSAGTYNILQSSLANQLGARKGSNLDALGADVIATGNIGCATHLARHASAPLVHTVELLDWATGGPKPAAIA